MVEILILTLAIARLTLILVQDDIMLPVREFVFKHSPPEAHETNGRWDKNPDFDPTGPSNIQTNPPSIWITDIVRRGWWGQVFSCPDCMGVYVAAGVLGLYLVEPTVTIYVCAVFAASMATSLLSRHY